MYFCSYKCCFTSTLHFFRSSVIWCAFSSSAYSSYVVTLMLMRLFWLFSRYMNAWICVRIFCVFIAFVAFIIFLSSSSSVNYMNSFSKDMLCCVCLCGYDRRCICLYRSKYISEDTFFWLSVIAKNLLDVIDMHSIFMLFKHQSTRCCTNVRSVFNLNKKGNQCKYGLLQKWILEQGAEQWCYYLYGWQFVTSSMLTHIFFSFGGILCSRLW